MVHATYDASSLSLLETNRFADLFLKLVEREVV
jgi:hypothetical protein